MDEVCRVNPPLECSGYSHELPMCVRGHMRMGVHPPRRSSPGLRCRAGDPVHAHEAPIAVVVVSVSLSLSSFFSVPLFLVLSLSLACTLSLSLSISRTRVLSPSLASRSRALSLSLLSHTRVSHSRVFSLSLVLVASQGPPTSPAVPCLARRIQCHRSAPSTGRHSASHRRCAMSRRPPAPRGISAKVGMSSSEPCPRPGAKDTSCTLRPCCALARAEPPQLRSSSGSKRYILNALLMLRTFECKRYTLKVTCRLNVRGVSPQSRPRCMIDQPTCIAVKEPIVNVHLTFTDHPTLKTLGHISRSHGRALLLESLHIQHSGTDHQFVGRLSSSLPLQSAPYASTSPRTLRTPYRALNALSSTQMRAPHLTLRAFSRNHLLLHTKRADCTLPLPARCPARTSPPRCTSHLPATPKRCLRVCFHAFSVCTPARP